MQATIKRVHIISRYNGGWAVKKQGASRALKVYPTREDAVIGSFPFLQSGYDLVIHRTDGSVEQFKRAGSILADFSLDRLEKKTAARSASPGRSKVTASSNMRKKK